MKTKKHPGGRPTKYRPEFCEMLIKHMESGLSFESFGAVAGVWKDVLYDWARIYPEFSNAKSEGFVRNLHFYEKIGVAGMAGKIKGFNATIWYMNMKNRHGWRDHHNVDHSSSDGSMTPKGVSVNIDLTKLSNEELDALEKIQTKLEDDTSKS